MRRGCDPVFSGVLVGTDGTPNGEEAVRQGARIVALTSAEMRVAFAIEPATIIPVRDEDLARERERAADALEEAGRIAAKEGLTPRTELVSGSPVGALSREAQEMYADLICVGSDAGFPQKPRLWGRVVPELLRESRASVLVCRVPPGADERQFPKRMVCATDGSAGAEEAVRVGAALAAVAGAELQLLQVISVELAPAVGWSAERRSEGDPLMTGMRLATRSGRDPSLHRALGDPAREIVSHAAHHRADLVVVGSRELHGVRRALAGSVSAEVARHAPCSVLVVHPRPA